MTHTIATILALTLSLAACGSVEEEAAPDGGPASDGGAPPMVLSIEPTDGHRGVMPDAVITVVFDRAMDPDSVREAWSSELIPAEAATFSWNQASDTLTVDPIEPLPVAEGDGWDPDVIDAIRIDFSIGTSARDSAGQSLAERFESSLYTVRRLNVLAENDPGLTDSRTGLSAGDDPADLSFIYAGDTAANVPVRAVASFWIPFLLSAYDATVESATLTAEQTATSGSAYDLGELEVWHVKFATLQDAYSAGPIGRMGVLSTGDSLGQRSAAVANAVAWALYWGEPAVQFRLQFENGTDDDDTLDAARFGKSTLALTITYLMP
jgi:hypothetical protein